MFNFSLTLISEDTGEYSTIRLTGGENQNLAGAIDEAVTWLTGVGYRQVTNWRVSTQPGYHCRISNWAHPTGLRYVMRVQARV